ncbi:MAG: glycerol-3-phosphate 1-O-acyltransferase PlsY [Gemmatimonadetes bacterium]|nr:glycerol-3-phosphate 1-O-acyltransferase PlsY [Gemmatimonadota bacterium]
MTLLLLALAYLIGATPTSLLVGRLMGVDLRREGSGNLGATNAFRVLGWKPALPILIVDVAKGWFPTWAFPLWVERASPSSALLFGAAAIVGHVYSVWVGFRGGKGVATSAGVLLALAPLGLLAGLVVWTGLVWATGYVSLASIVAAPTVAVVVWLLMGNSPVFWLTVAVAAFIVWAHRSNIRRLAAGQENRFGRKPEHG